MNKINWQNVGPLAALAALAVVVVIVFYPKNEAYGQLDSFAKCLSDKGTIMYGADWCPHCQNEKRAFGDSFRLINYVECPGEPQKCVEAGINGYPTWVFASGQKLEGEQGISKLSEVSGCPLITNN